MTTFTRWADTCTTTGEETELHNIDLEHSVCAQTLNYKRSKWNWTLIQTSPCLFSRKSAKHPPDSLAKTPTPNTHTLLSDITDQPCSHSTADGIRGRNRETHKGPLFLHSHLFSLTHCFPPCSRSLSLSLFLSYPRLCLSLIPAVSLSAMSFVFSEL